MSALSERCEQRKAEAQALAEKYNAGVQELEKLKNANAELLEQFKSAKYNSLVPRPLSGYETTKCTRRYRLTMLQLQRLHHVGHSEEERCRKYCENEDSPHFTMDK